MNNSPLIQRLLSVEEQKGMKLGLEECSILNISLGSPDHSFQSIHIAGTNGKGSVATKIAKSLEISGYKVGLFTSPHISTFRERIQINGELIPYEAVENHLQIIYTTADRENLSVSFFEAVTLLAFCHFSQEKVDFAVLETGLGGRLDATNIIAPILSVITSISLDHTHILGKTSEAIAKEKGGIIKPGIPVVIGSTVPLPPIEEIADKMKSPLTSVKDAFLSVDQENQAIAREALRVLGFPACGISVKPPCRMEWIRQDIVLDVAHNPEALKRLFQTLRKNYPECPLDVTLGLSTHKDIEGCLSIIKDYAETLYLLDHPHERIIPAKVLLMHALEIGIPDSQIFIKKAFAPPDGKCLSVVCGTFFIMDAIRKAILKT